MILKKISKLHLIHFVIVYILFYIYTHGIEFEDHGYYNIKYFFVLLISILIIIMISKFILARRKKSIFILYFSLTIILLYLLKNYFYNFIDCKDWIMGLNNTFIDNNKEKYGCQIKIPDWCPYKIGKYFLDGKKVCKNNILNPRENLIRNSKSPYISKNSLHIGYPLMKNSFLQIILLL